MAKPEISIIMPLYNAAPYIRDAIDSILAQTFRDFEMLIVDDGSTDGGPDVVRAIGDERIRLLTGYPNGGPAAARNRGLALARGSRIAFFDSDDIATPGMIEWMAAEAGYDIVTGWFEGIDEAGRPNGQNNKTAIAPEKIGPAMLFRNCIPTSALMIRRECVEGQEFDESLQVASDYDMWSRLVIGRKAKQIPRVLVRYRTHQENISHRKRGGAAECLHRIYRRQLSRLGLEAGADEIDLHAGLTSLTFGTSRETVLAVEKWLLKLDAANAGTGLYSSQAFRETLGERWYAVCHSAGGNGLWTWRRYFASPLSRWFSPNARQRYHLLRLSARGALKKMLAP
jgi:glycosyltransferase involved in cell wall biosynthesis